MSDDSGNRKAWSAGEDRPYVRPAEPPDWSAWLLAIAVIAAAGLYGAWHFYGGLLSPARLPQAPAASSAPAEPGAPAVQYPIQGPTADAAASLPTLDNSDSLMRRALSGLLGREAFERFVAPDRLVRRIVATVDNLPRATAPRRMMPVSAVPGAFAAAQIKGERTLDARNFARYAPFVSLAEAMDSAALVRIYAESYPLFQKAYDELGFGGRNFNDRLVEAIDDLLAAPAVAQPIRLVQRKVLYEFADPELESISAGQKILLRMGPENAARLKKKLRELREALVAARP